MSACLGARNEALNVNNFLRFAEQANQLWYTLNNDMSPKVINFRVRVIQFLYNENVLNLVVFNVFKKKKERFTQTQI